MNKEVLEFIKLISDSHNSMETIFTSGSCYNFYLILKNRFPSTIGMYDYIQGHVVSQIDGRLYDITGELTDKSIEYIDLHKFWHKNTQLKIFKGWLDNKDFKIQ